MIEDAFLALIETGATHASSRHHQENEETTNIIDQLNALYHEYIYYMSLDDEHDDEETIPLINPTHVLFLCFSFFFVCVCVLL